MTRDVLVLQGPLSFKMASPGQLLVSIFMFYFLCQSGQGALQLANYYGDHMVLQRGPQRAILWGTASRNGDTISAEIVGHGSPVTGQVQSGKWLLKLPAVTDPGPFVIKVSSSEGQVTLNDVLFGDVWLCSGQSNMELRMNQVNNSEEEQQRALAFSTIRVFQTAFAQSDTPLDNVSTWHPWGPPTSGGIGGLSAVCWLFGEYLQLHLNYPIGLVQTCRGGTSIEAWSPPEAINACPSVQHNDEQECCPKRPLVLWNAMIHPFLNMTIFGAIWYQGESNVGYPEAYSCQMKQLVKQWRDMFHKGSVGETSLDFPFGYVQLSALNPPNATQWEGYPDLRWAQTVGHGYSPNPDLPYTFMAVAMDLPDFSSPYGAVHTRFKQDVCRRLVLGALHVAYGRSDVTFQGPFPTHFTNDASERTLTVQYDYGRTPLDIRATYGFQICCASSSDPCNSHGPRWMEVPITKHGNSDVTLSIAGCSQRVMGLRYAWRDSPCELKKCAIYAADSGLPAPPYMTKTPVT